MWGSHFCSCCVRLVVTPSWCLFCSPGRSQFPLLWCCLSPALVPLCIMCTVCRPLLLCLIPLPFQGRVEKKAASSPFLFTKRLSPQWASHGILYFSFLGSRTWVSRCLLDQRRLTCRACEGYWTKVFTFSPVTSAFCRVLRSFPIFFQKNNL